MRGRTSRQSPRSTAVPTVLSAVSIRSGRDPPDKLPSGHVTVAVEWPVVACRKRREEYDECCATLRRPGGTFRSEKCEDRYRRYTPANKPNASACHQV